MRPTSRGSAEIASGKNPEHPTRKTDHWPNHRPDRPLVCWIATASSDHRIFVATVRSSIVDTLHILLHLIGLSKWGDPFLFRHLSHGILRIPLMPLPLREDAEPPTLLPMKRQSVVGLKGKPKEDRLIKTDGAVKRGLDSTQLRIPAQIRIHLHSRMASKRTGLKIQEYGLLFFLSRD